MSLLLEGGRVFPAPLFLLGIILILFKIGSTQKEIQLKEKGKELAVKTPKQVIADIRAKGDLTLEALMLAAELTAIFGPEELLRRLRLVERNRGKLNPDQSRARAIRASPALAKAAPNHVPAWQGRAGPSARAA